jgi:hypothetical protein
VFDPGIAGMCTLPLYSNAVSMKLLYPTQAGEGDTPLSSIFKICHHACGNAATVFQAGECMVIIAFIG